LHTDGINQIAISIFDINLEYALKNHSDQKSLGGTFPKPSDFITEDD
jgi:hypothetical protein